MKTAYHFETTQYTHLTFASVDGTEQTFRSVDEAYYFELDDAIKRLVTATDDLDKTQHRTPTAASEHSIQKSIDEKGIYSIASITVEGTFYMLSIKKISIR